MDGLPGMQRGSQTAVTDGVKPIKKMVGPYAPVSNGAGDRSHRSSRVFTPLHLVLVALLSSLATALCLLFFIVRVAGCSLNLDNRIWR